MAQIPGLPRYVQYAASQGQTVFTYHFKIYSDNEIKVQLNGEVLLFPIDYTVTGVGVETGGTIVLTTGADLDDEITITGNTIIQRGTEFTDGGDYLASAINGEYNLLDYITEELLSSIDNSIKFDPVRPGFDTTITTLVPNKALKVNSTASAFIMSEYDPDEAQSNAEASAEAAAISASAAYDSEINAALSELNAAVSAAEAAASAASIDLENLDHDIIPDIDNLRNIGSDTKLFSNIFTHDANIQNDIIVNTDKFIVDGTTGDTSIGGNLLVSGTIPFAPMKIARYGYGVPNGSGGGGYTTANVWQQRPINVTVFDTIGTTLSGNTITIPIGSYHINVVASSYFGLDNPIQARIRVYDTTNDNELVIRGPQQAASTPTVAGPFTVTEETDIIIQMQASTINSSYGMGYPVLASAWGIETYLEIVLIQLDD